MLSIYKKTSMERLICTSSMASFPLGLEIVVLDLLSLYLNQRNSAYSVVNHDSKYHSRRSLLIQSIPLTQSLDGFDI